MTQSILKRSLRVLAWFVALGLLVTAGGLTAQHSLETSQSNARLGGLSIPVQTLPAKVQSVTEIIGGTGAIQPSMPVTITNKVIAEVLRVPFDEGSVVHRGDLLVEFDSRLYRANLQSAQADYEHSSLQVERLKRLQSKQFAAVVDVENAVVARAHAREVLESARFDLGNTRIYSPVNGIVLTRSVNPGEMGKLDQSLMLIGVIDPVLMIASVTEDKIGHVYQGMEAEVSTDAFTGETFRGQVAKIDYTVDPVTRSFLVSVRLANRNLRLTKGITGYVRLTSHRMMLTLPSTAVMNPVGDMPTVFVVDSDGRAHLRAIRTGLTSGGLTEVLSGIQEGDQIVVAGQAGLRDTDKVRANRNAPWNNSGKTEEKTAS